MSNVSGEVEEPKKRRETKKKIKEVGDWFFLHRTEKGREEQGMG